ncbi:MAG: hypothetical protein R8G66_11990 [Cytophagales bacterium]|nr:hypothetical protein [Cytophagales bacterium]
MKKVFVFLLIAAPMLSVMGQDFTFDYMEDKLDASEVFQGDLRNHPFGTAFSEKILLFSQAYTYQDEPTPLNPAPALNIEKLAIYSTVKKMNAYYKKSAKKGKMGEGEAKEKLKKVLDIALCVRYQDTIAFEEALNNAKGLDAIAAIYESTELEGYAEFASSN